MGKCERTCDPGFADCNLLVDDGCEVFIAEDARNCGACNQVCPVLRPFCIAGSCSSMGCLAAGKSPPRPCEVGHDPIYGSPWVICSATCDRAWLSHDAPLGGLFHPQQICRALGYADWSGWGGTMGSICGTNEGAATSCAAPGVAEFPLRNEMFNKGSDANGPIIGDVVEWTCVR